VLPLHRRSPVVGAVVGGALLGLLAGCAGEVTTTAPPAARLLHQAEVSAAPTPDRPKPDQPEAHLNQPDHAKQAQAKPDPIAQRLARMSLRDKVRQLVVLGFGGRQAPVRLIRNVHPGGLIYFAPNLATNAQIHAMSRRSQVVARRTGQPLLIMTDQEGGLVTRLPGTSGVPGGAEFHGNTVWARHTAVRTAHDLVDVGINVDLAPVADVNTVGSRGVIGSRSFSSHPLVAARMVRAQVCGYHRGGVATTVKHFPGHGSTTTDSHLHPARIRETKRQWQRTDRPPFARAVASRVDLVMLGHLSFPAMDPSGRPATISARLDRQLLRKQVGFHGVVITDALNMGGITSYGSTGSIAVRAIRSGVDLLLMPPQPAAAIRAVAAAVHRGTLSEGRLNTSVRRILELKLRLGLFRSAKHLPQCR
jgi:beta-N-acetylhexosaminidase